MKKLVFLIGLMISLMVNAQTNDAKTALLLIDIQDFYFAGGASELINPIPASLNAQKLLFQFRQKEQLIIHVKHGTGSGTDIHPTVSPLASEKVIVKNEVNSFIKTDLLDFLQKNGIKKLVICGMQTHMCVEAATRAASDLGFECIVISDACATKNLTYAKKTVKAKDVQISTLATLKSYASIMNTEEYLRTK
jgi:nicotinamidase-related amidase